MILLDGSAGEGGGQVLRTALSLALATSQPFRIDRIRAQRRQPGLQRQHLAAVQAAQWLGNARVEGAELGASSLRFEPGTMQPSDHQFDIGSAGSATLVAQTLLPPLLRAERPVRIVIAGGTHNPLAPPYEFLERVFVPLLRRMGAHVELELLRPGYFPRGGGAIALTVAPCARLLALELDTRGTRRSARAEVRLAHLSRTIAERELDTIRRTLRIRDVEEKIIVDDDGIGPGNVVLITLEFVEVTELFAAFGSRGVPAERVAMQAVHEATEYLNVDVAVGTHLADQLLVPLALAGGGRFTTLKPSAHTLTNASLIERFVPVRFDIRREDADRWIVDVQPSRGGEALLQNERQGPGRAATFLE